MIEDDSLLRDNPAGALLTQRSRFARVEPLAPEVLYILVRKLQIAEPLVEQGFYWSVLIEDSEPPTPPRRSALPSCANHRMGRILLLRRTPVNPIVIKYNSIGEVGGQPTSRRLSAHREYGTSCDGAVNAAIRRSYTEQPIIVSYGCMTTRHFDLRLLFPGEANICACCGLARYLSDIHTSVAAP